MANLSQIKRQRMMDFLAQIKEEHKDDDAMLIALGEIESELNAKKYGLVWEEHEETVDVKMRTHIPVFTEDTTKEITCDANGAYNFLLEGDNLHSLRLLEKTHEERIDVIYIDPPYNTGGNDFIYDDAYIDSNDTFRHSKWLSFMRARLIIMQRLLKNTGLIFISIGEQEISGLKLLCDEIFGENNIVTIFSRQMKSGGAKGKYYTPNIDYVLAYAKDIRFLPNFKAVMTQKQIDTFYNKTETAGARAGEVYGEERLFKASLEARPNQRYYIQCPDGSFAIPPGETFPKDLVEGQTVLPKKTDKVWKWIYPRYQQELAQNNIVFKRTKTSGLIDENGEKSKWNIYNKLWLSEQQNKGVVPSNFITEFENRQSAAEMKKLGIGFTYHEYTSGFATSLIRSTSEQLFEQHCEGREDIEWVYKNGDTGQQYFSIVYLDGIQHQWLFYADYIVMKKDGTVWVIETKGGEAKGKDKNIDRQIENKFNAFKDYAEKHDLHWGFVRDKDNRLYINNTEYVSDMADDHWKPLIQEF